MTWWRQAVWARWLAWAAVCAAMLAAAGALTVALTGWQGALPRAVVVAPIAALLAVVFAAGVDVRSTRWGVVVAVVAALPLAPLFVVDAWDLPIVVLAPASFAFLLLPAMVTAAALGVARGRRRQAGRDAAATRGAKPGLWKRWGIAAAVCLAPWAWHLTVPGAGGAEWWAAGAGPAVVVGTIVVAGVITGSWWWVAVAAFPAYAWTLSYAGAAWLFDDPRAGEAAGWLAFLVPVPAVAAAAGVVLGRAARRVAGRFVRRRRTTPEDTPCGCNMHGRRG